MADKDGSQGCWEGPESQLSFQGRPVQSTSTYQAPWRSCVSRGLPPAGPRLHPPASADLRGASPCQERDWPSVFTSDALVLLCFQEHVLFLSLEPISSSFARCNLFLYPVQPLPLGTSAQRAAVARYPVSSFQPRACSPVPPTCLPFCSPLCP